MFYALVYMSVVMLAAYTLRFPYWAVHVLAVGTFVITMVFKLRDHPVKVEERAYDPALLVRVQDICARLGWTEIEPVVVKKALPLIGRRHGRLSVPVSMGALLTEAELDAAITFSFANQRAVRRHMVLYWSPWVAALVLVFGASLYTTFPLYLGLALIFVIWAQFRAPRGLGYARAARAAVPHFLALGGDPQTLMAGMLKVNTQVLRAIQKQPTVVGNLRGTILTIADAAGIGPEQLHAIGQEVGAPRILYQG